MKLTDVLDIFQSKLRLGLARGPSSAGWYKFRRCPHAKHRTPWGFGINPSSGVWHCYSCDKSGGLKDFGVKGNVTHLASVAALAPRKPLAPSGEVDLPWTPISPEGPMATLERYAVEYLALRGVDRATAARAGMGYGWEGKYAATVVYPWFDDDGLLAGWQARLLNYDPETDRAKVITARRTREYKGRMSGDGDYIMAPNEGALIGLETVRAGSPVVVVEGFFDALSVARVMPAVATLGSAFHPAQFKRLIRRNPSKIIMGYDPGKEREVQRICATYFARTTIPLEFVEWGDYAGDWAADEEDEPTVRAFVEQQLTATTRFTVGHAASFPEK